LAHGPESTKRVRPADFETRQVIVPPWLHPEAQYSTIWFSEGSLPCRSTDPYVTPNATPPYW